MTRNEAQKAQRAAYMRQYRLDRPDYAERVRTRNRERYLTDPAYYQNVNLKHKFGLTREAFLKMLTDQDGVCAACKQPETIRGTTGKVKQLAVDHDRSC